MFVIILLAVTAQPVLADNPPFALDTCIIMKGNKIYGQNLFMVEDVAPGSIATFTMTGKNNPQYVNFGLPKVKGENFSFIITEDYVGSWAKLLYKLEEYPQTVSVEINGMEYTAHIMSISEALMAFANGTPNPCPVQ